MFSRQFLAFLLFLVPYLGMAGNSGKTNLKKEESTAEAFSHFNYLDVPAFKMYFQNNGNIQDPTGNRSIEYPKGSGKSPLFASGFAISGYVNDSLETAWMASASRNEEWQPGNMVNGLPADPNNPKFRVYKYTLGDAAATNPDVAEWPIDLGAEFIDNNNNGLYEPHLGEFPKIYGNQMVWYVINDGLPSGAPTRLKGSNPMGLETQVSSFFFSEQGVALDHTAFIIYKIINKGGNEIKDMVFSLYSDPDLGDAIDDLVGVDSLRSLAYCYNETNSDKTYGIAPPTFGYDFFLGPKVFTGNTADTVEILGKKYPGYKSLGMNSFAKLINGRTDISDPVTIDEARNYQIGLKFDGSPYNPLTDGLGGLATDNPRIIHPGVPENSTGWRDAVGNDRRMMINTKPFTMLPGDTQVVIVGYIIGKSSSNLASISDLRTKSDYSQEAYNNLINIKPVKPKLGTLSVIVKDQNGDPVKFATIAVSPAGTPPLWKTSHDSETGPFTTVLYEGMYDIRVVGYDGVWGFIPDGISKTVSITENNVTELNLEIIKKYGYYDTFEGTYASYWKQGCESDTLISGIPVTWTISSGQLVCMPGSSKGIFSVTTTVDVSPFTLPTFSLKSTIKVTNKKDTLVYFASGDNGKNWVKLDSYLEMATTPPKHLVKSYDLNSILTITDSVKIRFQLNKNSNLAYARLDSFVVNSFVKTSITEGNTTDRSFRLLPAYPNPFNPSTTIRWIQPGNGSATIRVMNLLGQEVKVISAGARISGENEQTVSFNGLTSGIYFYRIDLNGKSSSTGKLMLLK
ncbi:MAG: T9SS type A sorting domain-containing protein [Bacteroidetes bacterium]|nr:T9SS type A sorting domain-containing protein [Bacteroidota bacterium]